MRALLDVLGAVCHATFPNTSTYLSYRAICVGRRGTVHRSCYHWLARVIFTSQDYKTTPASESHPLTGIKKGFTIDLRLISWSSAKPWMLLCFSVVVGSETVFASCLVPASDVCWRALGSLVPYWWSPWFRLQKGQNFGTPMLRESGATNLCSLALWFCLHPCFWVLRTSSERWRKCSLFCLCKRFDATAITEIAVCIRITSSNGDALLGR